MWASNAGFDYPPIRAFKWPSLLGEEVATMEADDAHGAHGDIQNENKSVERSVVKSYCFGFGVGRQIHLAPVGVASRSQK